MAARPASCDADRGGAGRPARCGRTARARIVLAGALTCSAFVAALHVAIDEVAGACASNAPVAAGAAPEASERAVEHPEDADRAERVGGKRAQDEPHR